MGADLPLLLTDELPEEEEDPLLPDLPDDELPEEEEEDPLLPDLPDDPLPLLPDLPDDPLPLLPDFPVEHVSYDA